MSTADEPPVTDTCVRASRLKEKTVDQIEAGQVAICDVCREPQLFGCAVSVRLGYAYTELCSDCAAKLCHDLDAIRAWRPPKASEACV